VIGNVQTTFGHNLRLLRVARGWSRKQLGEAMGGYRESYIGALERGDRNLQAQTMDLLCELVGVGPVDLLQPPANWEELPTTKRRRTDATDEGVDGEVASWDSRRRVR
jgi:transcriptional regulator with XRE-family HTH domain